ncbi:MAG TPA: hypothetical protein DHW07_05180 [Gammaproteobacteria bacterium]|nr:hypothetical protein [Gammaproteobacteria bacterium]|tara:strand:+ start:666 stop:1040 length:375 start_codon:yes stop_codon:yes gene_type:complete
MINRCNPASEVIDLALWNLHKTQCVACKVALCDDASAEENLAEAMSDVAYGILSHLANATCEDCLQSLTDYGGKQGNHYDALLMELFEQVADEMIRRSDEKTSETDGPHSRYTRADLLRCLQEL